MIFYLHHHCHLDMKQMTRMEERIELLMIFYHDYNKAVYRSKKKMNSDIVLPSVVYCIMDQMGQKRMKLEM